MSFTPGSGVLPAVTATGPAITFATLDANYDGCTDLAIGIPSYTADGSAAAGAVQLLYGSKEGFVTGPFVTPNNAALPGAAQAGEHFGFAMAGAGNSLTVGAPGWSPTVSGAHPTLHAGEGIVMDFDYYEPSGFSQVWAVRKSFPHENDRLGTAVAPQIAAAPTATGHGHANAGCIAWSNNTADVGAYCGHHTGDRLGASLSLRTLLGLGQVLFAGSPTHEVQVTSVIKRGPDQGKKRTRTIRGAGTVEQFSLIYHNGLPTLKLDKIINQASPGVPGRPARGNGFGTSVSTFDGRSALLAIGVPGQKVKGHRHAGVVLVHRGSKFTTGWQQVDRNQKGVALRPSAGTRFGQAVALAGRGYPGTVRDFVLYVGVPNDTVSGIAAAGRVQLFYGVGSRVRLTGSKLLGQHGGAVAHARYGAAVD
jgi:hypothetical protein